MTHLNRLLNLGLQVSRNQDMIQVGPENKIDWILKDYIVDNREEILKEIYQRDSSFLGEGVGTNIANRIPSIFKSEGCGCSDKELRLNKAGPAWGEKNKETIVQMLRDAARKNKLTKYIPLLVTPSIRHIVSLSLQEELEKNAQRLEDNKKGDWFVAITTAPRSAPTLIDCIYSVRETGWEPTIFAEPGSIATNCPTVWNETKLGVWHNWVSACKYALETEAKHIIFFQDDIVLHPLTKNYVENLNALPDFLGLYTSKKYGYKKPPGIIRVRTRSLWGICGTVYSRSLLEKIISHPTAKKWKGAGPRRNKTAFYAKRKKDPSLIANSDTAIGKIMNALKRPMYFVNPSPARHIATVSSISHGGNAGRRNCNPCADYDLPLARQCKKVDFSYSNYIRNHPKQYKDLDQVITTSFSLKRIPHQQMCIQGWQRLGLKVIALQLPGEADKLRPFFPGVEFIEVERRHHKYPRTMITDHDAISTSLGKPTILCNADIEILYTQKDFIKHWIEVPDNTLQLGVRWNYDEDYSNTLQEPWGMDAFRLLPDETLPELGFSLGNCVWDYWVPYHYLHAGYTIRSDFNPGMFHLRHQSSWTKQDHKENMDLVCNYYSIKEPQIRDWMKAKKDVSGIIIPRDSPSQKIYFQHIPKTGGKSVIESIKERVESSREYDYDFSTHPVMFEYGHELPMGEGLWITILRPPIERLVSLYNYVRADPYHVLHQKANKLSLKELAKEEPQDFNNYMTRVIGDPSKYDLIGFTEDIPEFLLQLQRLLNLEFPFRQHYLNKSKLTTVLDKETEELLSSLNQDDITLYNEMKKQWLN